MWSGKVVGKSSGVCSEGVIHFPFGREAFEREGGGRSVVEAPHQFQSWMKRLNPVNSNNHNEVERDVSFNFCPRGRDAAKVLKRIRPTLVRDEKIETLLTPTSRMMCKKVCHSFSPTSSSKDLLSSRRKMSECAWMSQTMSHTWDTFVLVSYARPPSIPRFLGAQHKICCIDLLRTRLVIRCIKKGSSLLFNVTQLVLRGRLEQERDLELLCSVHLESTSQEL